VFAGGDPGANGLIVVSGAGSKLDANGGELARLIHRNDRVAGF